MATIIGKSDSFETLSGTSAGDILIGGAGENELIGRAGSDVFKASTRVSTQDSYDTILDFRQGIDKIDVSSYGISSFDQLKAILTPANSDPNDAYFNAYWDGRSHAWQIVGINADDLKATDFKFSTLTGRTVEGTDSNDYGVDDRLFGTKGNDVLKGYAGDDQIFGGNGNDTLIGGNDQNKLSGGAGADIFAGTTRVQGKESFDTIMDFRQGTDKIDVSSYGISSFDQLRAILTAAESDPNDAYFNANWGGYSHSWQIVGVSADSLKASDFKFSTLTGRTIDGTNVNDYGPEDRVFGTTGNDIVRGNAGDDQLFGGNGNDTLIGGNDDNALWGGVGADVFTSVARVAGWDSSDTIMDFRQGTDKIDVSAYGISSFDQLKAILTAAKSDPNDAYFNAYWGGYSHEWQIVGISADSLKASDFKFSTLTGRAIDGTNVNDYGVEDRLFGTAGNDVMKGYAGDDQLFGGNGNDTLIGGANNDGLFGGKGQDKFVFNSSLSANNNVDRIADFVAKDDVIQLENSIFTKLTKTGTLSANFFAANTTGKATDGLDRIIYETDTGKLFYDADGSGSLKAIQFGLLETKPTISHFDFFVI